MLIHYNTGKPLSFEKFIELKLKQEDIERAAIDNALVEIFSAGSNIELDKQ